MGETTQEFETDIPFTEEEPEGDEPEEPEVDAEGAEDDGEPLVDDSAVETPPEPEGLSEAEMDKAFKSIDRRSGNWRKFVDEWKDETGQPLVECPLCLPFSPGYLFNPLMVPLSEAQTAAMAVLLDRPTEPDFKPSPEAQTCERCDGWGQLQTGSKVATLRLIKCNLCQGRGWTGPLADRTPAQVAGLEPTPPELMPLPDEYKPEEDLWGTPISHPDYGKSPQYRSANWAADLEAYKRGEAPPLA
jgi:hypothetical protein